MNASRTKKKGILLAGGAGSRLNPATIAVNKHLLPIHDKPLIYYSMSSLLLCNVEEVAIVCRPQDRDKFKLLFGDGSHIGITVQYFSQPDFDGIPSAILAGLDFFESEPVIVALGDNVFHGSGLSNMFLQQSLALEQAGCSILVREVPDPERFGVLTLDNQGSPASIAEKPATPKSNLAITGLYFFDSSLEKKLNSLDKSARNEFEIAQVLSQYMSDSQLRYAVLPRGTMWLDTGTFDSLADASNYVRTTQTHSGQIIGSPEEVAWRKGLISTEAFRELISNIKSSYGDSLRRALENDRKPAIVNEAK